MQEAIRLAIVNNGLLGLIGAPTYPMLRDATQRAFFEVLETNEIPYEYQKTPNLLTLENGSEIIFRSLKDFERVRGPNLAWFAVDELTYCREGAWLRLEARLRHPLAKELCGFGVWTPKGFDWVYDRFIGSSKKPGYEAVLAFPRENKYLPADYYDGLQASYDPRFAAQEVLGEYLNLTSGSVYHAFSRENVKPAGYLSMLPVFWSLDFNVDPMCSVIGQIEHGGAVEAAMTGRRRAHVSIIDEVSLPDSNTQEACEEFERRIKLMRPAYPLVLTVYGDPAGSARSHAGRSDYQIIREFFRTRPEFKVSYHVKASHPPIRDRVNAVNAMLLSGDGERHVSIDPKCKALIHDLERVIWKADTVGNMTGQFDKSNKKLTHMSDALGYMLESEFGFHSSGGPRPDYIA